MTNKSPFLILVVELLNAVKKRFFLFVSRYYLFIILFILSAVPFFWFSHSMVDYGGDSSRLYFYDPLDWLKNVSFYYNNSLSAIGMGNPSFFMIPFLLILIGLKYLLREPFLVNNLFSGVLLAGGFLSVCLVVKELLQDRFQWRLPAVLSGLFYIFSPILIYDWQKALYSINSILIYPLIFYFLLKFIKSARYYYLVLGILICFLFSANFNFSVIPWSLAFFAFSWLFFLFYSKINQKTILFIKGSLFVLTMFFLTQAFHILPQLKDLTDTSSINYQTAFSQSSAVDRGLGYFSSIQPYVHLIYNLENLPQYDLAKAFNAPVKNLEHNYGIKFQSFYLIFPIIILLGYLLVKNKKDHKLAKNYLLLCIFFIFLLFLMTGNVGSPSLLLYRSFFHYLPGFAMFRSYITKFSLTFIFFYALLIGFALALIFEHTNRIQKILISSIIIILIVFSGWPLISGKIVNTTLAGSKNIGIPTVFDQKYQSFLNHLKGEKVDDKYLSMPLTNEAYQVLAGKNGGAYFGPSILSALAGKRDFCGLSSFPVFKQGILDALKKNDVVTLNRYFSILNIGTVAYNSDDYIYDNFPSYPYSAELKKIFPTQSKIAQFIDELGYKKNFQEGYFFSYVNEATFLPHFYIPNTIHLIEKSVENLKGTIENNDFKIGDAIVYSDDKLESQEFLNNIANHDNIKATLEFAKISPAQYRIRIYNAKDYFPLIFSESYANGWKMYGVEGQFQSQQDLQKLSLGLSQNSDQDFAASAEEINQFIGDKKISYLCNASNQFISKDFHRSIQNDCLSSLPIIKEKEIVDQQFLANGYANGWLININKTCNQIKCIDNHDGTFNLDLIAEYLPQRLFYWGSLISAATIFSCVLFFTVIWLKNKKSKSK